jgi:hypothetical protein
MYKDEGACVWNSTSDDPVAINLNNITSFKIPNLVNATRSNLRNLQNVNNNSDIANNSLSNPFILLTNLTGTQNKIITSNFIPFILPIGPSIPSN